MIPITLAFIVLLVQTRPSVTQSQVRKVTLNSSSSVNNSVTDSDCGSSPFLQTPPDFRSGNTRISVAKCNEYLWQRKRRHDEIVYTLKCTKDSPPADANFIIGGVPAYPGEYPHMGAIGWQGVTNVWVFLCGGSLISPNYLLTAAHCSEATLRDSRLNDTVPKIVRLGYHNIARLDPNYLQVDAKIKRIIKHPEYKSPMKYNDIALMELDIELKFTSSLQPACLWSSPDFNGLQNKVTVTGWGITEERGTFSVKDLLVGTLDIIDSATCDNLLMSKRSRLFQGLRDNQLCAGTHNGSVDTCQGDSGGPIQSKINISSEIEDEGLMYFILGVTSFGFGCGRAESPGVYSKVYSYLDWIETIVWP